MFSVTFKGDYNCCIEVELCINEGKIVYIHLANQGCIDTKEEFKAALDLMAFVYENLDEVKDFKESRTYKTKENRIYKIEEGKK
jgi:hypothetical protein